MNYLFLLASLILLGIIIYQDFEYRAVSWIVFPTLAIVFAGYSFYHNTWEQFLQYRLMNLSFIGLQLLLLSVYFYIKSKRWVNITQGLVGWGDILFFMVIAFLLSPVSFLLFYIASLAAVALVYWVLQRVGVHSAERIPLAGGQAIAMALLLLYCTLYRINYTQDIIPLAYYG